MLAMDERTVSAMDVTHTIIASKLGDLTVVAREGIVVGVFFQDHWHRPDSAGFGAYNAVDFEAARNQISEYLAGDRREFTVPMATDGDAFQELVWAQICGIPYGETATYGELARQIGDGSTPKDVGAAVGRNPLCILVPCHRVLGAGGKLTGYAGGLKGKRFLLDLEAEVAGRSDRLF